MTASTAAAQILADLLVTRGLEGLFFSEASHSPGLFGLRVWALRRFTDPAQSTVYLCDRVPLLEIYVRSEQSTYEVFNYAKRSVVFSNPSLEAIVSMIADYLSKLKTL